MDRLSAPQLDEWRAYANLEPFGQAHGDLGTGLLASLLFNANRDPQKSGPLEPGDFFPHLKEPTQPALPNVQQLVEKAKMLTVLFGGTIK